MTMMTAVERGSGCVAMLRPSSATGYHLGYSIAITTVNTTLCVLPALPKSPAVVQPFNTIRRN